ncbi:MAG: hypothetical protein RIT27_2427 [Pseudomonadota bacterium]|jgi:ankyrin repeat protein
MGLFNKLKDFIESRQNNLDEEEDDIENNDRITPEMIDQPPEYTFSQALHLIKMGDLAKIKAYLKFNPKYAICKDWDDHTLLHRAAHFSRFEIVKLLLSHGAEVNALYKEQTPLHFAISTNDLWAKANKKDVDYHTHQQEQFETVNILLQKGADVSIRDDKGETPLHLAVRFEHLNLVMLLLKNGSNVEELTEVEETPDSPHNGRTPLLVAARSHKNPDILTFLLKAGANPNFVDSTTGYSALLYIAAAPRNDDISKETALQQAAEILLQYGADPNLTIEQKSHQMAIHLAAANNHVGVAEALLNKGADVNAKTDKNATPMSIAARQGAVEMVKCLLKHKVDINESRALFHAAFCRETTEVMDILLKAGADINAPDPQGVTPLFAAVYATSLQNVQFLLSHGADTKLHPPGRTLLQHAFASWGSIEALPENKKDPKIAEDAVKIIEMLGGFDSLKKKRGY